MMKVAIGRATKLGSYIANKMVATNTRGQEYTAHAREPSNCA